MKKLKGKGERFTCPRCKSDDISGDGIDGESLTQDVTCNKCDLEWTEFYKATRWEEKS